MYLTYAEYQAMGGTLDEATFNDFEFEARSLVDYYTFKRLKNETTYPEELKRLMYRLIGLAVERQLAMGGTVSNSDGTIKEAGITSQSNDGVSVSYNVLSASQLFESLNKDADALIKRYLQGVMNSLGQKLLYRGLYPNE